MNDSPIENIRNEIGKSVYEFFIAEVKLNCSFLKPQETATIMIMCAFSIFISALKSGQSITEKTLYHLYDEMQFDKMIRRISEEIENIENNK